MKFELKEDRMVRRAHPMMDFRVSLEPQEELTPEHEIAVAVAAHQADAAWDAVNPERLWIGPIH